MFIVKNFGGGGPPRECASKPWSFCSACKKLSRQRPLGAEIWFSKKSILVCPNSRVLLCVSGSKVHRTFFAERGRNRCRSHVFPILDISIRSGDIRDRSLKLSEVNPNFARFWPQLFWGGGPPKFGDLNYPIQEPSDHLAKFFGDRPTEL